MSDCYSPVVSKQKSLLSHWCLLKMSWCVWFVLSNFFIALLGGRWRPYLCRFWGWSGQAEDARILHKLSQLNCHTQEWRSEHASILHTRGTAIFLCGILFYLFLEGSIVDVPSYIKGFFIFRRKLNGMKYSFWWYVQQDFFVYIVKPVYNDHPGDPKIVVVVQSWFM